MSDYNNIVTDKEIYGLFRQRLLEQDVDDALNQKLIDMETKFAFSNNLLLMPDLNKEKELLDKLGKRTGFGSPGQWLFTGLSFAIVAISVILYANRTVPTTKVAPQQPKLVQVTKPDPENEPVKAAQPAVIIKPKQKPSDSPVAPREHVIITTDSLPAPAPKPAREAPTPILYFAGARGVYKTVTRMVNDSNHLLVDTSFKGIKRVEIDGSFCDIAITTHAQGHARLNGEIKFTFKGLAMRKPEYQLHYTQNDSILTVWVENKRKGGTVMVGSAELSGHLDFELPKNTALVVKSCANITVKNLEGQTCQLTSYGNIAAQEIKGALDIQSYSGNVTLGKIIGDVNCKASYGNLDCREVTGDLKVSSASGNVKLLSISGYANIACQYGNVDVSKMEGNLVVSSASGHVYADDIRAGKISINCAYGDIKLSGVTASITLKSSSGDISVNTSTGNITAHASYGNMHFTRLSGDLVLGSSSGNIDISKLTGSMFIASSYGNISASDCTGQVSIQSTSGDISGKNIQLVKDLYLSSGYGDVRMNLKNDLSELSFNLSSASGNLKVNKEGLKLEGREGKLTLQKGEILVRSTTTSGDQLFD